VDITNSNPNMVIFDVQGLPMNTPGEKLEEVEE